MKHKKILFAVYGTIACLILAHCSGSGKNPETVSEQVIEIQKNPEESESGNIEAWDSFKMEMDQQIILNENEIISYREREQFDKVFKEKYASEIDELELRNEAMKTRMNEEFSSIIDNWQEFKLRFTKDMEQLGDDFQNFSKTVNK